ncbi:hypothetical protein HPB51_020488 [Rhipicephalus microplus]|uniref:Uncharacterized protein n=1 Tax=Rhipicephalus microplus TaxID=6941 RepID=A0A9J6E3G5_RHIMP|nr:hypothetical protein HPB51_020488 [Rhipicephalus microplus]
MFKPCRSCFVRLIPSLLRPLRLCTLSSAAILALGYTFLAIHFPPLRNLQASLRRLWKCSFGSSTKGHHHLPMLHSSQPKPEGRQTLGQCSHTVSNHKPLWRAWRATSVLSALLVETFSSGRGPGLPPLSQPMILSHQLPVHSLRPATKSSEEWRYLSCRIERVSGGHEPGWLMLPHYSDERPVTYAAFDLACF